MKEDDESPQLPLPAAPDVEAHSVPDAHGQLGGASRSRCECTPRSVRACVLANFWRYCASGFVQNFSQYYYWILIPLVAEDRGASAFELGLIQCLGSLVYALVSLGIGAFVVERVRSGVLARIAFSLFLVACGIALATSRVWPLFIAVFISGTGNAFYWGPVQNAVGREAGAKSDSKTARFSVFHALGKSIGFVLGGYLKGALGATASFVADMVFSSTQLVFLPLGTSPSAPTKYSSLDERSAASDGHTTPASALHGVEELTPAATPDALPPHTAHDDGGDDSSDTATETPSLSLPMPLPPPQQTQEPSSSSLAPSPSPVPSPSLPRGHQHHGGAVESATESREFARNTLFLYLSWIMNFGAYGSMNVVANQYIKLIVQEDIGFGSPAAATTSSVISSNSSSSADSVSTGEKASSRNELFLGAFLCLVYLAQMTMFLVGSTTQAWMYKRLFVYGMEALGCVCLGLISVVRHPVALLFVAFGCGLMAGTGYLSSYTYSFHSRGKSGRLVGLQETVLSISSVVLPPLAGSLVSAFDEVRAPYWMCSAFTVVVVVAQETTYRLFWRRWNRKCEEAAIELRAAASGDAPTAAQAAPQQAQAESDEEVIEF